MEQLDKQARKVSEQLETIQKNLGEKHVLNQTFRKLDELYDVLEQSFAVMAEIPKIVQRLKLLKTVHVRAAEFVQRLETLEQQAGQTQSVMEHDKQLLEKVCILIQLERNFAENLKQIQENFDKLKKL